MNHEQDDYKQGLGAASCSKSQALSRQLIDATKLRKYVSSILAPFEINMSEWAILIRLSERAACRPTDLADFTCASIPLVIMTVRPLQERGLVGAIAKKSRDGRDRWLSITEQGRALVEHVEVALAAQAAVTEQETIYQPSKRGNHGWKNRQMTIS